MVLRQVAQQFGHAGSHPAITATPVERNVGRMVEKAVGALQLVQVHRHLAGSTVYVLTVAGHLVGMRLHDGNHIHVVNPKAGLPRVAFPCPLLLDRFGIGRHFPLGVGIGQSQLFVSFVLRHPVEFQGQAAEHVQIHVVLDGQQSLLGSEEMLEAGLQQLDERLVLSGSSIFQGAVPVEGFRIANPLAGMQGMFFGDKAVGDAPSYFVGGVSFGEVLQQTLLRCQQLG